MKKYRIITDGEVFRVQRKINWGVIHYWRNDYRLEINDTYPKVIKHLVEFSEKDEAIDYIKRCREHEKHKHVWRVVEKFEE
jgi:hypothetical protein